MATNKEIIEGVYANFTQGDIPAVLAPRSRRVTRDDCSAISSESFRLLPPAAVGDHACRRRARCPPTGHRLIGPEHPREPGDGPTTAELGTAGSC